MLSDSQRAERARIAALTRHHKDDPEVIARRQAFKADRLAEHIRRVVDTAPPLTAEQRGQLATLLHPTADLPDEAA